MDSSHISNSYKYSAFLYAKKDGFLHCITLCMQYAPIAVSSNLTLFLSLSAISNICTHVHKTASEPDALCHYSYHLLHFLFPITLCASFFHLLGLNVCIFVMSTYFANSFAMSTFQTRHFKIHCDKIPRFLIPNISSYNKLLSYWKACFVNTAQLLLLTLICYSS